MCPRPRKVTDEQLFAATYQVMSRVGPGELTLAAIAAQAGVTPAVLVQRFGSKRQLLLTLSQRFAEGSGDMVEDLARRHRSPLAALRAYAGHMAEMAVSPAALARSLAYLQIDLTDPEFREHLLQQAKGTRRGVKTLLRRAVATGELEPGARPEMLARAIEALIAGSLLTWAYYQQGTAEQWVRDNLDTLLEPWKKATHSR